MPTSFMWSCFPSRPTLSGWRHAEMCPLSSWSTTLSLPTQDGSIRKPKSSWHRWSQISCGKLLTTDRCSSVETRRPLSRLGLKMRSGARCGLGNIRGICCGCYTLSVTYCHALARVGRAARRAANSADELNQSGGRKRRTGGRQAPQDEGTEEAEAQKRGKSQESRDV